jgi:hypothetical protein
MSYIRSRSPEFKVHSNIGHAKSAVGSFVGSRAGVGKASEDMWIYELKDGKYEVKWFINKGMPVEELPWAKRLYHPPRQRHTTCHCPACTKS